MSFTLFLTRYLGKATDTDNVPVKDPVQCVDLIKLYLRECFNIKAGAWGNARDYYECFNSPSWGGYKQMNAAFTRIKNTPAFIPMRADICIWTMNNKNGHIAIAEGTGNTQTFYTYDQNWGGKAMKKVKHNYTTFLGVLRPKRTIKADVNIRSGPGISFKVLGEKKTGEKVTIYETNGNWGRIGDGRWIHMNYVLPL